MDEITRSLSIDLTKYGATVNVNEPVLVIDDRSPRMDDRTRDLIVPNIPMKRAGLPSDIANAVLFFCSPTSGFLTGQALIVDGGHRLPDLSSSSEEHTSELQSLLRISYALFCLKTQRLIDHNITSCTTTHK